MRGKIKHTSISIHLTFSGNCEEAMQFYKDCFGGELQMAKVKDTPFAGRWMGHDKELVLQAILTNRHIVISASDMGGEGALFHSGKVSLKLECSEGDDIQFFFNKLARGGRITHPLKKHEDTCIGALQDKYGINWIINQ